MKTKVTHDPDAVEPRGVAADTPLWQLTVGQFRALVAAELGGAVKTAAEEAKGRGNAGKWLVYGMEGLARLMGCGKTQAAEVKRSGILDEAITQNRKTIIIDAELALRLLRERGTHGPCGPRR